MITSRTINEYCDEYPEAAQIFDAQLDTPEGDELALLLLVIKDYEQRYHPVPSPDPIEAIKLTMQEKGLIAQDLVPLLGSKSYVSQVLNRKKPLTADMMRSLHQHLGIPAEVLLAG
ncbi:transcriptional regulator [Tunicatimonas pelagia]|nr:transcriptional regulator [Tunicatimonas pelagia]WKN46391.1 transcriptional regulator [Tunicatimonas pelagia]